MESRYECKGEILMERFRILAQYIQRKNRFTLDDINKELKYSKRKSQMMIKDMREQEKLLGFEIETIRGEGYLYKITNVVLHDEFIKKLELLKSPETESQEQRIYTITILLLLNKRNITINEIATIIDVSRSTIQRDLVKVENLLLNYRLKLNSSQFHMIEIQGEEIEKRRLFSRITKEIENLNLLSSGYHEYTSQIDSNAIRKILAKTFKKHGLEYSANAVNSIMDHIYILLYRLEKRNYITDIFLDKSVFVDYYYFAANDILQELAKKYGVDIPQIEVDFLTIQLIGKSNVQDIPLIELTKITNEIESVLVILDEEFSLEMRHDEELKQALLYHIYPLLIRLSYGFELQNSMIDFISIQYTNSFLIAIRFVELFDALGKEFQSRDEIGYLAIHFASYIERLNKKRMHAIRSILLLSDSRKSTSALTRQKIENIFPEATVVVRGSHQLSNISLEDADIILTTEERVDINDMLIFKIDDFVSDSKLTKIKNTVTGSMMFKDNSNNIRSIFYEELFFTEMEELSYLDVLKKYSKIMVEKKYAAKDFPTSLMDRELRFTTVYDNGIAGPHSIDQNAIKNSIAVIKLTQECNYQGKEVDIIFMINAKKGYLFLYKSISDLLINIIEDSELRLMILNSSSFKEFHKIIERMV